MSASPNALCVLQESSVTDEQIARQACESVYSPDYGPGRCKTGQCGGFHFYHFDAYPSCDATAFAPGAFQWVFRNDGMQHVSEDADGVYNVSNATTAPVYTTTAPALATVSNWSLSSNGTNATNVTTVVSEPVPDMLGGDGLFTRVRNPAGSRWSWGLALLRLGGQLHL